jgi:hypothetical protein
MRPETLNRSTITTSKPLPFFCAQTAPTSRQIIIEKTIRELADRPQTDTKLY